MIGSVSSLFAHVPSGDSENPSAQALHLLGPVSHERQLRPQLTHLLPLKNSSLRQRWQKLVPSLAPVGHVSHRVGPRQLWQDSWH